MRRASRRIERRPGNDCIGRASGTSPLTPDEAISVARLGRGSANRGDIECEVGLHDRDTRASILVAAEQRQQIVLLRGEPCAAIALRNPIGAAAAIANAASATASSSRRSAFSVADGARAIGIRRSLRLHDSGRPNLIENRRWNRLSIIGVARRRSQGGARPAPAPSTARASVPRSVQKRSMFTSSVGELN